MLYNQDGSFGILAFGPQSPFWYSLVDPETNSAQYSFSLARPAPASLIRGASTPVSSNITLGGANSEEFDYYYVMPSMNISTSQPNQINYTTSNFSFGIMYYDTTTGVDESEYFTNLTAQSDVTKVVFDLVTQGMGLPTDIYNSYVSLLTSVQTDAVCGSDADAVCTLPGNCSSNEVWLNDWQFKIQFDSSQDGTYIRVPLATFAEDAQSGDCNILVGNTNITDSGSTALDRTVVLGGMFFQEFFGLFTNKYITLSSYNQSAAIYVNQNSEFNAYVGNEVLPTGANPFPQPPNPS